MCAYAGNGRLVFNEETRQDRRLQVAQHGEGRIFRDLARFVVPHTCRGQEYCLYQFVGQLSRQHHHSFVGQGFACLSADGWLYQPHAVCHRECRGESGIYRRHDRRADACSTRQLVSYRARLRGECCGFCHACRSSLPHRSEYRYSKPSSFPRLSLSGGSHCRRSS